MINNINDEPKMFRDECEFNNLLPVITLVSRRVVKDLSDLSVLRISKGAEISKIDDMINNLCLRWMNKMRRLGVHPINIDHKGFRIKYKLPESENIHQVTF